MVIGWRNGVMSPSCYSVMRNFPDFLRKGPFKKYVRPEWEGGGRSAKSEESILKLEIFLIKKRTGGEGGSKVNIFERTYFLNGP